MEFFIFIIICVVFISVAYIKTLQTLYGIMSASLRYEVKPVPVETHDYFSSQVHII